jgi:hypothetical protein
MNVLGLDVGYSVTKATNYKHELTQAALLGSYANKY